MSGQGWEQLTLFPADSHASPTALRGKGLGRKTSATYGRNSFGWSENLDLLPLWVRMCLEFYRQSMPMYAPTWKMQATKCGRFVFRLTLSVRTMRDTGWRLWPSARASQDFKPIRKQTPQEHCGKHGNTLASGIGILEPELIGQHINPRFAEWLMGFPEGWTDV